MGLVYGSVCSGIEACSQAWHSLGWEAAFFAETEAFPSAVLRQRWPEVTNAGDFTAIAAGRFRPVDLLAGGTPCQSYSVAGKRGGLDDQRGNLTLGFGLLARRLRPLWLVWENVPGVLSLDGGRTFGTILAAFAGYPDGHVFEPPGDGWRNSGIVAAAGGEGYGLAWRVCDAQYVRVDTHPGAVPQRRRRVFVVGYLGDWHPAAAVLLEQKTWTHEGATLNPACADALGHGPLFAQSGVPA